MIENISVDLLIPNPRNPRQDLGYKMSKEEKDLISGNCEYYTDGPKHKNQDNASD